MPRATNFPTIPLSKLNSQEILRGTDASKPVVLVVDDETIIADTLAVILEQSGFVAMAAYDARQALEIADLVPPDLLLSDVVMPGMSGVDLAIAVRQTIPACRILLFSGQSATMDLLEAAGEAGRDFTVLSKPLHPKDLLAKVSQTLDSPTAGTESDSSEPEASGPLPVSP
jgi:DNA-binding response OmpR family regulator